MLEQPSRDAPPYSVHGSYGKDEIRLVIKGDPTASRLPEARELTIAVEVGGPATTASFETGNNAGIVPSDTLRRHILSEIGRDTEVELSNLARRILRRLTALPLDIDLVELRIESRNWELHQPQAWVEGVALRATRVTGNWTTDPVTRSVADLPVMKTGGSNFAGFQVDPLTVQQESFDRPLAGLLQVEWESNLDSPASSAGSVVATLQAAFHAHSSDSTQQLAAIIGGEVLANHADISTIGVALIASGMSRLDSALDPLGASVFEISTGPRGVSRARVSR